MSHMDTYCQRIVAEGEEIDGQKVVDCFMANGCVVAEVYNGDLYCLLTEDDTNACEWQPMRYQRSSMLVNEYI